MPRHQAAAEACDACRMVNHVVTNSMPRCAVQATQSHLGNFCIASKSTATKESAGASHTHQPQNTELCASPTVNYSTQCSGTIQVQADTRLGLGDREAAVLVDEVHHVGALQQLHHNDARAVVRLCGVVLEEVLDEGDDVGVPQARHHLELVQQRLQAEIAWAGSGTRVYMQVCSLAQRHKAKRSWACKLVSSRTS